ncbi:MAG TPA: xanthine dehydrogenase family protein molybdopterin-binding subunit [Gaiellaceae bacterium]|nr:xanthine dehydrogenase family protein molybdopterin-binding subunit [Gaiellaceae bacterium]
MSILGNRVLRKEDPRFLRGEGSYVENLSLESALDVTFVRSPVAHARITGIDASAAEAMPNVQVLTGADVDVEPITPPPPFGVRAGVSRPLVAKDVVRFVGEIVAIVVSQDRVTGADARELVFVDYDPLPVVVDVQDALKDEVLLFPEVGTNVSGTEELQERDEALFDGCDVVVSGKLESQRMAPCPLEPRSAAAEVGPDGRVTAWLSTQAPHGDRQGLAARLGLEPEQIRVIAPDVGGGFGAKTLNVEDVLVVWLSRRFGRPVRWTESRSESMVGLPHGRGQHMSFTIGSDRDGKILAYRLESVADAGAYPALGSFLPHLTLLMSSGVYAIPRIEASSRSVATNTVPTSAFRGAGRPEATQAIERAVDLLAAEVGIDPAEIRRRNFIDTFPHETETGAVYDSGDYEGALDLALRSAGYEELRAEQRRRREEGGSKQLGIGLSTYVEITNGVGETEFGEVEITEDGGAILRTGSFSHGQGHETTFAMIASEQLGIPLERITVVKGDTDAVASGTGTYASKSTQIGGVAARLASDDVVVRAKQIVADYLEASPADIVLDPAFARLHVAGSPAQGLAWEELAERASADGRLAELRAQHEWKADPSFPFGAHVAVVEVDVETGVVELIRHVAVDDAGTLINPLVADGQVHGGVATGVGQAIYERFAYDENGTPMTSTFADYSFPSAADLPSWERVEMVTPTPYNALGVKGIGESGTIGATPAVHNAVLDALAPYGVTHVDMPANGENVWRALQEAK